MNPNYMSGKAVVMMDVDSRAFSACDSPLLLNKQALQPCPHISLLTSVKCHRVVSGGKKVDLGSCGSITYVAVNL